MGNPITKEATIGTIGELLVQLRLLQYGVQAAPPIKDSGNDLIAIKGEIVRFIQVKTSTSNNYNLNDLPDVYHIVALVDLKVSNNSIYLDDSRIFIIKKDESVNSKRVLTQGVVDELWP